MARLDLRRYDVPAPMEKERVEVEEVSIPLKQHIGAPAIPVVRLGEHVKRGQLVADIPEGALGARYHASMDGIVKEVGDSMIIGSEEG